MAGGGVHYQSLRLVDHDQLIILIDDGERDVLAGRFGGFRLRHIDCDGVAGFDVVAGIADRPGAALDTLKKLRILIRHAIEKDWRRAIANVVGPNYTPIARP